MRRLAVLGAGGAGKTVLANELGRLLGLPVVHLDALRYDPAWNLTPDDDFAAAQRRAVAGPAWVIDGNNTGTLHLRAAAADTIIILDPHPLVCLAGVLHRQVRYRGGQHPDGIFVRVTAQFLGYVLGYRRTHLPRVLAVIREHGAHADLLHLTSRRAARRLLAGLRRPPPGGPHRQVDGSPEARGDAG